MFEVFDPRDGLPVFRFADEGNAAFISRVFSMDYALEGEGW